jgi:hypothetical protein
MRYGVGVIVCVERSEVGAKEVVVEEEEGDLRDELRKED